MSTTNLFEYGTRNKLRFSSTRGELSIEQLWDVPLRSRDGSGFDLNEIAKTANKLLKSVTEESFVEVERTPIHARLELSLEVVKLVIETKLAEEAAEKKRAENKAEKEKLLKILAEKQDGKLSELSEQALKRRISELG